MCKSPSIVFPSKIIEIQPVDCKCGQIWNGSHTGSWKALEIPDIISCFREDLVP
jgi:hypothetical protein